ncbi:MAG: hypothetical protein CMB64_04855 [Euryarchaeota archaeon]|nr:hypothetical protein [Euryarchaeota archaeon]|tara:strand:- start:547 stop:996 length:450 start_codon:yes stop_codon:yes gene_type:complete
MSQRQSEVVRVNKNVNHQSSYLSISEPLYKIEKNHMYVLNPAFKNQTVEVNSPCSVYISPELNTRVVENIILRFNASTAVINVKDGVHYTSKSNEILDARLCMKKTSRGEDASHRVLEYAHNCIEVKTISNDHFHCKLYGDWIISTRKK